MVTHDILHLPTQLMLLVVVVMLDLLNAEVLEGTELKEVGRGGGGRGGKLY